MDLANQIIAYESGELSAIDIIKLFSELVKNGMAWTLQGQYGRKAEDYIDAGILSKDGKINYKLIDKLESSV